MSLHEIRRLRSVLTRTVIDHPCQGLTRELDPSVLQFGPVPLPRRLFPLPRHPEHPPGFQPRTSDRR